MYESFYGLKEKPFQLNPDSGFLYLSKSHQAALSRLEYALVSQPGISVITGTYGSGKTTVVRKLLKKKYDQLTVGLLASSTVEDFDELMEWILYSFDLPYQNMDRVSRYHAFTEFLISQYSNNHRVILIIDEAQNLSEECLEQLRLLLNVNADKHELLQLILLGEDYLVDVLRQPQMRAFLQRVSVDCKIEALSASETTSYIVHRVSVSGGNANLFSREACDAIFLATQGNPGQINCICDTALLYGFAEQKDEIDIELINAVVNEKRQALSPLSV